MVADYTGSEHDQFNKKKQKNLTTRKKYVQGAIKGL